LKFRIFNIDKAIFRTQYFKTAIQNFKTAIQNSLSVFGVSVIWCAISGFRD